MNTLSYPGPVKPILILDTNVLLDVFVFSRDPLLNPLRDAVRSGDVTLLATPEVAAEFLQVLKLDKVPADAATRERAAMEFAAMATVIDLPPKTQPVPKCADRDDQVFLDLAVAVQAPWLLSRDKKVLRLRKRFAKLELPTRIMHPLDWCAER